MTAQPSVSDWYKSLDTKSKYIFEDEQKIHNQISEQTDFLSLLEARRVLSQPMLTDILGKKSRVVIFGAGGTASWFLPKLLKIYNDAFTKAPSLAYALEIIIVDGDEI